MLDPKLLEILACPLCRQPVVPDQEHAWLYCHACSVRYRVDDGIPMVLPDEAQPIPAGDDRARG